jgi:iron(III) transport system permease protein
MSRWRIACGAILLLVLGVPALLPVWQLCLHPGAWQAWSEFERLTALGIESIKLAGGSIALALPLGVICALLLERTRLPGKAYFRFAILLGLFIPLPLYASAWQGAFSASGVFSQVLAPPPARGVDFAALRSARPWSSGMLPAVLIHASAAWPWVTMLVALGLRSIEPQLEEDASLLTSPSGVLWHFTLRRLFPWLTVAAVWVGLLTFTEITVSDVTLVRTYAEEVYTQKVMGNEDDLARAVATALPPAIMICLGIWLLMGWWERALPPMESSAYNARRQVFPISAWALLLAALVGMVLFLGVPLGSLIWKLGEARAGQTWSLPLAGKHLGLACTVRLAVIVESVIWSLAAGLVAASLALVTCWLSLDSPVFRGGARLLAAFLWAMPGPILGLGLEQMISILVDAVEWRPFQTALYYGPSPLPTLWAHLLRLFPFALALIWPTVRQMPRELREASQVEGGRPWQELTFVVAPAARRAYWQAVLGIAILALGELGASKILETPGSITFAHEVFTLMHYGLSNDLAAHCLLLLIIISLATLLWRFLASRSKLEG